MPTHKFYMVQVDGQPGPAKRFDTIDEARKQAARLAIKEGNRCYILESIEAALPPDVTFEKATIPQPAKELTHA